VSIELDSCKLRKPLIDEAQIDECAVRIPAIGDNESLDNIEKKLVREVKKVRHDVSRVVSFDVRYSAGVVQRGRW
jgi:hypothetical protein